MAHILLIEDAIDCQILVKESLAKITQVSVASTLGEARAALAQERFDLIILDLSLPDGDGLEFFSQLQGVAAEGGTPVIFLTAQDETAKQVEAFSLGAEDYVVKPLRPAEFRARIEARLRRIVGAKDSELALVRGDLRIELGTQRAFILGTGGAGGAGEPQGERELDLTGREFKLLCQLARHEGKVLSRDELIAAVWGKAVHVLDRTVDTHVYTLRKKLGPHAAYIESEVGHGYRLNASKPRKGKIAA